MKTERPNIRKVLVIMMAILGISIFTACSNDNSNGNYSESYQQKTNTNLQEQYKQKALINSYWESEVLQESMSLQEYLNSTK